MERENISVDIITVHGHEHVVVINGMAFELDPGMFDPTIHKIEWVAGQGVIYWEDGRENTLFGKDGYDVHIAPLVRAFGEEQRRVEDNVIILDAERRQRTYATAKQRANLLSQIREVEEKMARSTQAILAAQLAGKVPEGEDVHHFLSNYTRKLELRAQLATPPHGDSHMLNHRMTRPPVPQTGYGRLDAFGPNPGEQRHGVGNRMGCGLGPLPFVPPPSHWCAVSKASPGEKKPRSEGA